MCVDLLFSAQGCAAVSGLRGRQLSRSQRARQSLSNSAEVPGTSAGLLIILFKFLDSKVQLRKGSLPELPSDTSSLFTYTGWWES